MSPQSKKIACPPSPPPPKKIPSKVPKQEESEREERSAGYKWKHHRVSESRSCLSPLLLLLSQPIIIYWAFNPPPLLPLPPVARMVKEIVSETFLHGKVQGWILLTSSHSSRSLPPSVRHIVTLSFFPDRRGRKKEGLSSRQKQARKRTHLQVLEPKEGTSPSLRGDKRCGIRQPSREARNAEKGW